MDLDSLKLLGITMIQLRFQFPDRNSVDLDLNNARWAGLVIDRTGTGGRGEKGRGSREFLRIAFLLDFKRFCALNIMTSAIFSPAAGCGPASTSPKPSPSAPGIPLDLGSFHTSLFFHSERALS